VTPSVCQGLIESRATGLLQLFERKGLLPRTLKFRAALGDRGAVRASLDENGNDLSAVNEAFLCACRFEHEAVASLLLERSIALDAELGKHVGGSSDRLAFVKYLIEQRSLDFAHATPAGPWQAFVMEQVMRAVQDGDLTMPSHTEDITTAPASISSSAHAARVNCCSLNESKLSP